MGAREGSAEPFLAVIIAIKCGRNVAVATGFQAERFSSGASEFGRRANSTVDAKASRDVSTTSVRVASAVEARVARESPAVAWSIVVIRARSITTFPRALDQQTPRTEWTIPLESDKPVHKEMEMEKSVHDEPDLNALEHKNPKLNKPS